MGGEKAAFGFSDPPWNLPASSISGLGKHQHGDFLQGAGEMSPDQFTRWLTKAMRLMAHHSRDGSLHAFFMGYQFLPELLCAGNLAYGRPKAICTWIKGSPGMGGLYRAQTEVERWMGIAMNVRDAPVSVLGRGSGAIRKQTFVQDWR